MWHIGQDIVCIKTHSQGIVKEGQVYTIKAIKQSCCMINIDVGIPSVTDYNWCRNCLKTEHTNGICWLGETLFKPLDDLANIEELLEELELETIK